LPLGGNGIIPGGVGGLNGLNGLGGIGGIGWKRKENEKRNT